MNRPQPRLLLDNLVFPEGPRWHAGSLWFSDMHGHEVVRVDLEGRRETVVKVPAQPSGLGFLPDGRLLIASMKDRRVLRLDPSGLEVHADLGGYARGEINDMVVDRQGRAYVGQFGSDTYGGEAMRETSLMLVEPDGRHRVAADGLLMPNGAAITPDGATLILSETYRRQVTAFDIEPDGGLSNRRVWAELGDRRPDGICLDAEGCLWVGVPMYPGGGFVRVAEGGEIPDQLDIESEGMRGIACVLGGPDRRHLFLLEAARTSPRKIKGRDNGRVRVVEVDVPGAGIP